MIRAQGSVPYPPTASSAPIRRFADSLRVLADGLQQSTGQLVAARSIAGAAWSGPAASAFGHHVEERSRTVQRAATAIGGAVPALEAYAGAIDATSAAYTQAALAEHAARAGLPWTSAALAAALAAQQAAASGLTAAGATCASALSGVEGHVTSAAFTGVDPAPASAARVAVTEVWQRVGSLASGHAASDTDVVAATAELDAALSAAVPSRSPWGERIVATSELVGHLNQLDQVVASITPRPVPPVPPVPPVSLVSPAASRVEDVTTWRRSPILSSTGQPFVVGPDGRIAPARSSLVVGPDGRPFPLDPAGRPVAGPRIVVPGNGGIVDWTHPSAGSLDQRLAHIGRRVDALGVRLDEPIRHAPPTVSSVRRLEAGARSLLRGLGRAAGILGVGLGLDDVYRGVRDGDLYRASDGVVSVALAAAGLVALANPIGLATVLVLGVGWSVAGALSGDVPVTRRLADATDRGVRAARHRVTDAFAPAPAVSGPAVVVPAAKG